MTDPNTYFYRLFYTISLIAIPAITVMLVYQTPAWIILTVFMVSVRIVGGRDIDKIMKQLDRQQYYAKATMVKDQESDDPIEQLAVAEIQSPIAVVEKPNFNDPDRDALVEDLIAIGAYNTDFDMYNYQEILGALTVPDVVLLEEYRRFTQCTLEKKTNESSLTK